MRILTVGKGGREHAIITALAESGAHSLFCHPGSDAISTLAEPVAAEGIPELVEFMLREEIDLCVAGEESYLVKGEGLANACAVAGIPCWGPVKEAAQLEASKEFAKEFLVRHNIPTGAYSAVDNLAAAQEVITSYPIVLKFDGLAAGKGVAVCPDKESADEFLNTVFVEKRFGTGRVLVEECLTGPEISIFASVVDGEYQILAPARDYKRIGDGDEGPNTGGMGAVSSRQLAGEALLEEIEQSIVKPTVEGLQQDGLNYRGFLYFGIMLTPYGPKMLEYNCRFGDPEAQAVMPMITGDFATYVAEGAKGNLRSDLISFREGWSICLILASAGYPESSRSGDLISGLDAVEGVRVYHAGTRRNAEGEYETNGGRVLAVVASGATREEARDKVYAEGEKITFDGRQRRSDIATLHFES